MSPSFTTRCKRAVRTANAHLTPKDDLTAKRAKASCVAVDLDQVAYVRVGPLGAWKSWAGLKNGKFLGLSNREASKLAGIVAKRKSGVKIQFR